MLVFLLAFFMLSQSLNKYTFSARLPRKEGKTCYAVKGNFPSKPDNNVYQGSSLLSGIEMHVVEAWNTPNFNLGDCDPGEKVTIKQYLVESEFEPADKKLSFRVYQDRVLTHEEIWQMFSNGKTNHMLSTYSNHELSLIDPEVVVPSLGEIAKY